MIRLKNLNKKYITAHNEVTALADINLSVQQGQIFGIIGKSGAGKSTLIRCVNLLEKPNSGQVMVDGIDLTALPLKKLRQARRHIGMIFQHFNLLSTRTVYENIAFPLELEGQKNFQKIIMPLLELTDLTDKKNQYPAQLSGGQKQRVAIARALAASPKVLLCDEATSALDPETTGSILTLLKNIRDQLNLTILLITHEMSVIKACCDRVAILDKGKLLEENNVADFFAAPQTEVAKNFIYSSLSQELPKAISQHISKTIMPGSHPLIRLWFMPDAATQPVIAKLINQFNLRVNILQGNVEYIKNHAIGVMVIAVAGNEKQLSEASAHLISIGVKVEIIGYVPNDVIPFA